MGETKTENIIEDGEELIVKTTFTYKAFHKMDAEWKLVLHRRKGPAVTYNHGLTEWYLNGNLHREDGPALVYNSGYHHYFLNGIRFPKTDYYKIIAKKRIGKLWDGQTKGV